MEQKNRPSPRLAGPNRRPTARRPVPQRPTAKQGGGVKLPQIKIPKINVSGFKMSKGKLPFEFHPIRTMQRKRAARARYMETLTPKQRILYRKKRKVKLYTRITRVLVSLLTVIAVLLTTLLCCGFVVFRGPSQTFGDLATVTMLETSALKFVPRIYYSKSTVEDIVERNSIAAPAEDTDTSLIKIDTGVDENGETAEDYKPIEVLDINGPTYHGYMMIVRDPKRVSVGVCRTNFNKSAGLQLYEIAEKYGAVGAINGGAFSDSGGTGNGGTPMGIVASEGEILYAKNFGSDERVTVGFTKEDKLVVGVFTGDEAKKLNLRDAVTFGPALIVNGEPCEVSGISSGLNPRTAIGQREDGAVLMLVIDGRQVNSMGATHADLMKIMLEYGAVNACNLDGGSSSIMYYEGKYLNNGVAVTGSRKIPTAFVVR